MRWDTSAVTNLLALLLLTALLIAESGAMTIRNPTPDATPSGFEGVVGSADSPSVIVADAVVRFRPLRVEDPYGAKGSVRTDESGAFHVLGIPPGLYGLEVIADGYVTRVDASAPVVEGALTPMDIRLRPSRIEGGPGLNFLVPVLGGLVLLVVMWRGNQRLRRMSESRPSARDRRARAFPRDHDGDGSS